MSCTLRPAPPAKAAAPHQASGPTPPTGAISPGCQRARSRTRRESRPAACHTEGRPPVRSRTRRESRPAAGHTEGRLPAADHTEVEVQPGAGELPEVEVPPGAGAGGQVVGGGARWGEEDWHRWWGIRPVL